MAASHVVLTLTGQKGRQRTLNALSSAKRVTNDILKGIPNPQKYRDANMYPHGYSLRSMMK